MAKKNLPDPSMQAATRGMGLAGCRSMFVRMTTEKTMKTKCLVLFSFASTMLLAVTAWATPPCEPGTNGSGTCSWTCSQNVYNVTCHNPDGPDRCYVRDENNNTTRAARCSNFEPYGSPTNFNPFLQTIDEGGDTTGGGRTRGGDGTSTPTLAPATTR